MLKQLRPALVMLVALHPPHRRRLSAGDDRHRAARLSRQANGSLIARDGKVIGSEPDRPELRQRRATSMARPSAAGNGYDAAPRRGSQPRPDQPDAGRPRRQATPKRCSAANPAAGHGSGRPRDRLGQRARSRTSRRPPPLFQVARVATARGLPEDEVRRLVDDNTRRPHARHPRRAAGQRAAAQPGARIRLEAIDREPRPG